MVAREVHPPTYTATDPALEKDGIIYEYGSAANPTVTPVPYLALGSIHHEEGPTRIIPFDLAEKLEVDYPATSPNLLAAYIRILPGESLETQARATSQAFYVIRGSGVSSSTEHGEIKWNQGDLFVLPAAAASVKHAALGVEAAAGGEAAALYWVSDEPLLRYLGVSPTEKKFEPTLYTRARMVASVELLKHEEGVEHRNRLGILLGNKVTQKSTLTLTHTLWSLLNLLPAGQKQRPHRHNSVALDLCVSAAPQGTYTLMGPELDEKGWVKNPIRLDWASGACFVTPPGWWHSHHNDSEEDAWVLPLQDAGLHTHMRTLNIEFSVAEKPSAEAEGEGEPAAPSSSASTSSSSSSTSSSGVSEKTIAALTSP